MTITNKSKNFDQSDYRPMVHDITSYSGGWKSVNGNFVWVVSRSDSTTESGIYRRFEDERKRLWQVNDQWKTLRAANGFLPTLPYSDSRVRILRNANSELREMSSYVPAPGQPSVRYVRRRIRVNAHWPINPASSVDNAFGARLIDEAKIKTVLKAKDMKVNIPVMFGEGRKTVRMLFDTARQLAEAYFNFRRGRFKKAADKLNIRVPKGHANNWLAYKYGWIPLLSEVKGLAELAAQQSVGRKPRFTVKSKVEAETHHSSLFKTGLTGEVHGSNRCTGSTNFTARAGLLLEISNMGQSQLNQVGILDPALVVWELIPFSFVFDWFISVGDWLMARTALDGLQVLAGFTALTSEVDGVSTYIETSPAYDATGMIPVPYWGRYYTRQHWDGKVPLMSLGFVSRDPLSVQKLITSAALWRQLSRRP